MYLSSTDPLPHLSDQDKELLYEASPFGASIAMYQNNLNQFLQQYNVKTTAELPDFLQSAAQSLVDGMDSTRRQCLSLMSLSSTISQLVQKERLSDRVVRIHDMFLKHCEDIAADQLIMIWSGFTMLAYGNESEVQFLARHLFFDERMVRLVHRIVSTPTELATMRQMMCFVMPHVAKVDFSVWLQHYGDVYGQLRMFEENTFSSCTAIYEEACKHPMLSEMFMVEAVMALDYMIGLRNERYENIFLNRIFDLVSVNVDKFFTDQYAPLRQVLQQARERVVESHREIIQEIFDMEQQQENSESELEKSVSGRGDLIVMLDYNGKKKKIKATATTLAQLLSCLFEKCQIEEDGPLTPDHLFDQGLIVEYYDEAIRDWIELEDISNLPRQPQIAKIRITREVITHTEADGEQLIERESIQLVNEKYQIIKRLGKGGFGTVYLANMYQPNELKPTLVALKYIEIDSIVNFNRSMREGIQMLQLEHDNIAKIFDVFEVQSSDIGLMGVETKRYLCFAMPFYSHGDLYMILRDASSSSVLTPPLVRSIMDQLMDSLRYLHEEMSIVHRDIKPQNILIETIDVAHHVLKPILSDFGLAKTLLKTETQIAGTASYISPEMSSRKGYHLKTDVWSMGIMFYQLLSGDFYTDVKGKICAENDLAYLSMQIERRWASVDGAMVVVGPLRDVTFKMLMVDQEVRPSALEVLEMLRGFSV